IFVSNHERKVEREAVLELKSLPLFGREGKVTWQDLDPEGKITLTWQDLDPGLEPPEKVMATQAEVRKLMNEISETGLDGEGKTSEESLEAELSGISLDDKALDRLIMRVEGTRVRLVVRPHDYRILEARVE
ncbi:MAG: hypothetical protein HQL31_13620, partial [Planctomycetes bacterium]|nr:hypothetical protein [Planctomycetota bacterium]